MEADPNIAIFVIGSLSLLVGLILFLIHIFDKKLHKDPYNLLLMGIIMVDEIMVIYIMFSILNLSKRSLVGC